MVAVVLGMAVVLDHYQDQPILSELMITSSSRSKMSICHTSSQTCLTWPLVMSNRYYVNTSLAVTKREISMRFLVRTPHDNPSGTLCVYYHIRVTILCSHLIRIYQNLHILWHAFTALSKLSHSSSEPLRDHLINTSSWIIAIITRVTTWCQFTSRIDELPPTDCISTQIPVLSKPALH